MKTGKKCGFNMFEVLLFVKGLKRWLWERRQWRERKKLRLQIHA